MDRVVDLVYKRNSQHILVGCSKGAFEHTKKVYMYTKNECYMLLWQKHTIILKFEERYQKGTMLYLPALSLLTKDAKRSVMIFDMKVHVISIGRSFLPLNDSEFCNYILKVHYLKYNMISLTMI